MNETQRDLGPSASEHDYDTNPQIQPCPSFINKFFFLNRIAMFCHYISQIKKQTIYRYNDNFKPMLTTNRILQKFLRSKEQNSKFNITYQIFRMEQRTIITLIIMSILAGLTSLVPIYFQSILVKAIMGNTGNYYSLAVIISVMFVRFNLLNYILNLSCSIAINIKLYLQNTFMRVIFYIEQQKFPELKNRIKFLDVDLIGQAFFYIPYFITSIIIVIGVIVFVFINLSAYGCIVLGVYLFFFILIAIFGKAAYEGMRKNSRRMAEREKFQQRSLVSLMKTAFERMSDYVYQLLIVQKTLQIRQNLKINILYILGQTMGECCVVVSNIILFSLVHNEIIVNSDVYYSVLFIITTFYPIRYSVYGFFTIIKGYEAFRQIKVQLKTISNAVIKDLHINTDLVEHEEHVFVQNIGGCFQYHYNKMADKHEEQSQNSSIGDDMDGMHLKTLKTLHNIDIKVEYGQSLMILSRIDSKPCCNDYLQQLIREKPAKKSLAMINKSIFMLPESLKQNILFYSPFDQKLFNRVLQITQLSGIANEIQAGNYQTNEKYIQFSDWHQSRIQIARALYNNVDYLILNRPSILDDVQLIKMIIQERKQKKKITIIANNTHKYYFKLVDKILVLGKNYHQIGYLKELTQNKESLFNQMLLKYHQKVDQSKRIPETKSDHIQGILQVPRVQEKPLALQKSTFFQFFSFVHKKSEFIIIISLFLPPCFKYYMQYLIGQSVNTDIFIRYLIFGLIYILFVFLRGFCLSMYTNYASLSLYRKICRKYKRMNAHQILQIYQKPTTDFDYHARIIDRNLVMDFQYGQSILIQIVVSFIVYCTGQPVYIAVAIPVIIMIVFINGNYAKYARQIYLLKLKQTKGIHKLVANAVERNRAISKYQKINQINNIFHAQNKIQLIYSCNNQWLETGVRTIAQFIVWLAFLVFLIIMIYTVQNISIYTSLVSLGCSMFINLMYLNTFYLKAFRQLQISLVSLTLCMDIIKNQPNLSVRQLTRYSQPERIKRIQQIQTLEYHNISLKYFKNICDKISLKINKGDRIVMSGNSNSFKEVVFYMLQNNIFDSDEIKGDIIINGQVERQFIIDKLFFLHYDPILPYMGNIQQAIRLDNNKLTKNEIQQMMGEFFKVMDVSPIFNCSTKLQSMTLDQRQLLQLFRAVKIHQCKVLVIINGFNNIDIVSRRKLTKYLIHQTSINIIIETTNLTEIIKLYPRHLVFKDLKVKEETIDKNQLQRMRSQSHLQNISRAMSTQRQIIQSGNRIIEESKSNQPNSKQQ